MEQQRQLECPQAPALYGEDLPTFWHGQHSSLDTAQTWGNVLQDISTASLKAAFGNEGSELSIWDIATQQRDYIAKGSKPNRIGLVDHSNNTAVAFIPGTEATQVWWMALCISISTGCKSPQSKLTPCSILEPSYQCFCFLCRF